MNRPWPSRQWNALHQERELSHRATKTRRKRKRSPFKGRSLRETAACNMIPATRHSGRGQLWRIKRGCPVPGGQREGRAGGAQRTLCESVTVDTGHYAFVKPHGPVPCSESQCKLQTFAACDTPQHTRCYQQGTL